MPTEHRDWYDTPLYYDIIFEDGTKAEANFMEGIFQRHALPTGEGRRLLEPACGSGRLVLEMARRGWQVAGFDGNARMLDFARARLSDVGQEALLWEDWMQSFDLPEGVAPGFDLAHCLVSTFKYLLREKDAADCLRRVAAALRPGGLFLLGLHLTDYTEGKESHERWVAGRDGVEVICNTHTWPADVKARQEELRTRLDITDHGRTHRQETRWTFRTYNAAQLKALLKKVPELELCEVHDFTYELEEPRKLDDSYADVLLTLRRR